MSVQQALDALDLIPALPAQRMPLARARGRVLGTPALAECDLPMFTQSAVDGYAVRHAELAVGRALALEGSVRAGARREPTSLRPGTARRIFTGGQLPPGADTVVRQEWVEVNSGGVAPQRPIERGADVRMQGEELQRGFELAKAGARITPGLLGALAAAGVGEVSVHRPPRITVLVTGDEVARPGTAPRPGQVHDANGPLVTAWLAARACKHVRLRYVADSARAVRSALAHAFAVSDLVVTTGGVSVGDHDHVPHAAHDLGAETLLWKVAQKPGKPLFVARCDGVPLLGLPGNPASVWVNLLAYVRKVLDRLEGAAAASPGFARGVLAEACRADAERDSWVRMTVEFDDSGVARLRRLPRQASHMLSNLASAGALAWIPASRDELAAHTVVRWLPTE